MATDEELIAAVAQGDEAALGVLYRRYERPLHQFLWRYTNGRDVDDLHQETWLRVVRAAPRFDPSRRFTTWLFQIAVNLCRDWHRRPPPTPTQATRAASGSTSTTDRVEAAVDAQRLLSILPEAQRAVVVLRYYHGLSEADVATILGCPKGTVKSRLHQALARMSERVRAG